jgi:pimeloyl-ACP methyl ester carboxylesterase
MESKFAEVNGVRLHYLMEGKGDPIVLLHGFAETSHMWRSLIAKLSDRHTVIAPDLRGFGESAAPLDGYRGPCHWSVATLQNRCSPMPQIAVRYGIFL